MIPEQLAEPHLESGRLVQIAPGNWLDTPLFWHRLRTASVALDTVSRIVRKAPRSALRQSPDR